MGVLQDNEKEVMKMNQGGSTRSAIAKHFGCTVGAVSAFLGNRGIKLRKSNYGKLEENKAQIIQWLQDGYSSYKIAKELSCAKCSVLKFITKHNLTNQNKSRVDYDNLLKDREDEVVQLYNEGNTCDDIAKITGHSAAQISVLLKNSDKEVREWKYEVDEHFFDYIDGEATAYVLGWFYSDGCVDNAGKMRIQIQKGDEDILYTIRDLMGYTGPIHEVPPPKKFPNRKPQVCLCINRKELTDKLISLGCMPNKSLRIKLPSFDIVPEHLFSHFIRGVFDGDGGIAESGISHITCCEEFLLPLGDYLLEKFGIHCKYYYRNSGKNTVTMMITKKRESLLFLEWIYTQFTYYLDRKYETYLGIFYPSELYIP